MQNLIVAFWIKIFVSTSMAYTEVISHSKCKYIRTYMTDYFINLIRKCIISQILIYLTNILLKFYRSLEY